MCRVGTSIIESSHSQLPKATKTRSSIPQWINTGCILHRSYTHKCEELQRLHMQSSSFLRHRVSLAVLIISVFTLVSAHDKPNVQYFFKRTGYKPVSCTQIFSKYPNFTIYTRLLHAFCIYVLLLVKIF